MAARTPSFWLAVVCAMLTMLMVHPSFAALFTVPADLALLFAVRWAARREGRQEGEIAAYDLTKAEATGHLIRRRPL